MDSSVGLMEHIISRSLKLQPNYFIEFPNYLIEYEWAFKYYHDTLCIKDQREFRPLVTLYVRRSFQRIHFEINSHLKINFQRYLSLSRRVDH